MNIIKIDLNRKIILYSQYEYLKPVINKIMEMLGGQSNEE